MINIMHVQKAAGFIPFNAIITFTSTAVVTWSAAVTLLLISVRFPH